jgi:radical SAM protein with 4Fe4S-binding SPASM domain
MQYPKRVTIELTNRCNRACQGCPRHKMNYPYGEISTTLFTNITDQLPDNVCIVPFFRGEPTLHTHFTELMNKLERFTTVQLATNGDKLTDPIKDAILSNVSFLSLSLHQLKMPKQTSWLKFLSEAHEKQLTTQVSIVENLLPKRWHNFFTKEWLKHVNQVRIYKEHSKTGFGSMVGTEKPSWVPCSKPMEEMVVYWDGKVGLCNHDWNNLVSLGDLNTQSIAEVWQGLKYKEVRLMHTAEMRMNVPTCRNCDFNSNKIYGEIVLNAHSKQ